MSLHSPLTADIDASPGIDPDAVHQAAIQSRGVLLCLSEPDLRIRQASKNLEAALGTPLATALQAPVDCVIGTAGRDALKHALATHSVEDHPLYFGTLHTPQGHALDAVVHRHKGVLILELEPAVHAADGAFASTYPLVRTFVTSLQAVSSVDTLTDLAAREVRRLTHFGRVTVYRIDGDGSLRALAEARDAAYDALFGTHLPGAGLTPELRSLTSRNPLRLVADINDTPVGLVPPLHPSTGRVTDLSYAALRAAAGTQRETMRRMGAMASLTLALTVRGQLWGLVACHHATPCSLSFEVRAACEHLAQILSLQIEAKEDAETANHAKDHFLAVLSHELRTPLTPILTAVHLLELRQDLPPHLVAQLEVVRRNAELEARLIDDLLDITGIARGKLAVSCTRVDLYPLLESTLEMSRNDMQTKRLSLKTRFEADRSRLFADGARIQQVIWNLVRNAVKFTPEGGAIEVRVWNPAPSTVAVAVKDTGIGIEPDALPRIFSAFEQADASITQRFGGLGLGLAIAYALVQKHGGSLTAESAGRHEGTTFTLTLPLATEMAPPQTPSSPPMPRTQPARGLHVLLVEDNADTAEAMSQMLEILGHTVTVAKGARAAMQAAESGTFDLLISDIGLPDGSGLDVVRVFAERQAAPSIAITGYGMEEDVARCRNAGFTDHLTKPVDFKRLESLLAGYLAARDARTAGVGAG